MDGPRKKRAKPVGQPGVKRPATTRRHPMHVANHVEALIGSTPLIDLSALPFAVWAEKQGHEAQDL